MTFESGTSTVVGIDLANFQESGVKLAGDSALRVVSDVYDAVGIGDGFIFNRTTLEVGRLVHSFSRASVQAVFVGPSNLTNPINRFDVNHDQATSAGDALVVINELARRNFSNRDGTTMDPVQVDLLAFKFYDVSGDDRVTAIDALRVINELSRQSNLSGESFEAEMIPGPIVAGKDDDKVEDRDRDILRIDHWAAKGPFILSASNSNVFTKIPQYPIDLPTSDASERTSMLSASLADLALNTLWEELSDS